MSVQLAFGFSQDELDRIISERWAEWAGVHEEIPGRVRSWEDLLRLLRSDSPARADAALRALARRAHIDHINDPEAAMVLAAAMLPAAILVSHQLQALDPEIDQHVAAHLWIQARTTPWQSRGRVAIGFRWRLWRAVVKELSLPDVRRDPDFFTAVHSGPGFVAGDDDELAQLLAEARRCGELSSDDVHLLASVLHASSAAVPGTARGAALLGERVSQAVAPLRGTSSRTVRRRTRRCIAALARLASA